MPRSFVPPVLLTSRNYPGFLGAVFLVLLRIAIGWHFLNEGLEKYESTRSGKQPFSAEVYLRNSVGPLAPAFRGMLPDADGRALLDLATLKSGWSETVDQIGGHYQFDEDQKSKARAVLEQSNSWADVWFNAYDNREARQKYLNELTNVERIERNSDALSYERERAWETRRTLEGDGKKLTAPLLAKGQELTDAVVALRTEQQQASAGSYSAPLSSLDVANWLTTYGLCAIGVCLILGFLTPLAALCAAAFLALIYLSIPPWPGLPPNPRTEGHYWIVSKNLIELIACLLIAVTASGHWFGLDALFFGARRRRRWARYENRLAEKYGATGNDKPSSVNPLEPVQVAARS
jgi:uncharacterized membrane protein YphA (DoxX/SURF4 family)